MGDRIKVKKLLEAMITAAEKHDFKEIYHLNKLIDKLEPFVYPGSMKGKDLFRHRCRDSCYMAVSPLGEQQHDAYMIVAKKAYQKI